MKRIVLAAALTIVLSPSLAHDAEHPELNDWFMGLRNKKDFPCCDGSEAMHLKNVDWESQNKENSHIRVRIPLTTEANSELGWVDVPDDAVITEPNKDGATLVWPIYGYMNTSVRCFMFGAGG